MLKNYKYIIVCVIFLFMIFVLSFSATSYYNESHKVYCLTLCSIDYDYNIKGRECLEDPNCFECFKDCYNSESSEFYPISSNNEGGCFLNIVD